MLFLAAFLSCLNFFVNAQYRKVYFGSDGLTANAFSAGSYQQAEQICKNFRIASRLAVLETERDKYYIEHAATLWRYQSELKLTKCNNFILKIFIIKSDLNKPVFNK